MTGQLTLASNTASGTMGNADSTVARISGDGQYVVFQTVADNLGYGGTGSTANIYRKNLVTGQLLLVSANSSAVMGNGNSTYATSSYDGRYVAFTSASSNLIGGVSFGVFYKDMNTGQVSLVSSDSSGTSGNAASSNASMSADGRYLVFNSTATNLVTNDTNAVSDIFMKDMSTGATTLVSQTSSGTLGNALSFRPALSSNARYVVFYSNATNLVAGDTNATADIFMKDLSTGAISLLSQSASGQLGNSNSTFPAISGDGQYILFQSNATNLVSGDTNATTDIFVVGNPTSAHYLASRMQWLKVDTQLNAQTAQTYLDGYSDELSQLQSNIGASQSRLESAASSTNSLALNSLDAASRITDVDFATESANLVRKKILLEAGTAILAQANQQPTIALSLLTRAGARRG